MKMRILLLLTAASLLAGSAAAQQSDQQPAQPAPATPAAQTAPDAPAQPSLADLARQNRAHKQTKVITDDDLPKTGGLAGGSASGLNPAPAATDTTATGAKPASDQNNTPAVDAKTGAAGKPEKPEKSANQDRITFLQKDLQDMQHQKDMFQGKLDKETDDSQRATWAELLAHLTDQMTKEQQELDQLQSKPTPPKNPS